MFAQILNVGMIMPCYVPFFRNFFLQRFFRIVLRCRGVSNFAQLPNVEMVVPCFVTVFCTSNSCFFATYFLESCYGRGGVLYVCSGSYRGNGNAWFCNVFL